MTAIIISGSSKANVEKSAQQLVHVKKLSDEISAIGPSGGL